MTKRQIIEANLSEIIELSKNGMTNMEIGNRFGCSGALVGIILKEHGIISKMQQRNQDGDLTKFKDEIVRRFESGQSVYSLAKDLGICNLKANKYLKKWGYDTSKGYHRRERPLKDDAAEIIRIYQEEKIGVDTIAKRFNTTGASVRTIINKAGIMRDYDYYRYDVDQTYFEKIDSPHKAYFLGLLMADGNVQESGFRINLKENDRAILDQFAAELKYSGGLKYTPGRTKVKACGSITTSSPQYGLCVNKSKMAQDLTKLGCMPNKTWELRFPTEDQLPRIYIRDFIRGYWDGDGYVSQKYPQINILGNQFFITELVKYLPLCGPPHKKYMQSQKYCDDPDKKILSINIGISNGAVPVLTFLYKDALIYLQRKYDLAMKWIS